MTYKRKSPWSAVDKDQLGYESNFNPAGEYYDGPRVEDAGHAFTAPQGAESGAEDTVT